MARPARALCGEQIAGTRGGLKFDGGNEGSSFGVPAAGAYHRNDGWSPLPNQCMKLTERAPSAVRWAVRGAGPKLSVTRQFRSALGESRLARSAAYAPIR